MNSRVALVVGTAVISALVTSSLWVVGLAVAYRLSRGATPPPFAISVDVPQETMVGETLRLNVKVSNPTDQPLELGSIDIYDSLLDGFTVDGVEPSPTSENHFFDFSTFYFSETLQPGESFDVSLRLMATTEGVWTGDVDACTPWNDYVTSSVTIRVKAE